MATVYEVKLRIVSEFCSYSEKDISNIIESVIREYTDENTGLKLLVYDVERNKTS